MRKLVWSLITGDATLNAEGVVAASVLADQSVDSPTVRPFLVLRWGPVVRGVGSVQVRDLTVWVHDEPADFARIDRIIRRLRTLLESAVGMQEGGGGWLVQADWQGDSADLADDAYGTITRNTSFRVVASGQ